MSGKVGLTACTMKKVLSLTVRFAKRMCIVLFDISRKQGYYENVIAISSFSYSKSAQY